MTSLCRYCAVGFWEECVNPTLDEETGLITPCGAVSTAVEESEKRSVGRPVSDPSEVKDFLSTGRKRAAMLRPIYNGEVCEWAGLKWSGGGVHPIVGCRGNKVAAVKKHENLPEGTTSRGELHHGPDKNTLNNSIKVNLHMICAIDHERWHVLNNPEYGKRPTSADEKYEPLVPYYAHDGLTKATEEELTASEEWWATPKAQRGPYPIDKPDQALLIEPLGFIPVLDENPFD
jgi:hypothetical protein